MYRSYIIFSLLFTIEMAACTPKLVKPELSLQEVELTGISFSTMDLAFVVKVKNKNSTGVMIEKLNYQLQLNDISLGSGELARPIAIEGLGSQLITLTFSASILGISQLLKTILGEIEATYRLKGEIVLSKFWIKEKFLFENKGVVPLNRSTFHH